MSDSIPEGASQPDPSALDYDLAERLSSVLSLRSTVPEDALTAQVLGTERAGHGVLID
ncbi:MAG: hypothetical protein GWO04_27420, partial [Actinobacteria bacterium]|nr:hypothetical protein [Actinomycetota bacterium]NIS33455.1 hypothetical protein [Actinomycetota bacterium]NIW30169.1 hypothetical protein [Actinomycetota bacterium]